MFEPMTDATRKDLLAVLESTAASSNTLLDTAAPARQILARLGVDFAARLYQVLEFTALLQFDLSTLFGDFIRNESRTSAHVYARYVILTIYEGTKTYRTLLGRDLQRSLSEQEETEPILTQVRKTHKEMNRISRDAHDKYGDVRNGIAAHRDADAAAQLQRLRNIGGEELALLVEQMLSAMNELTRILDTVSRAVAIAFTSHVQAVLLPIGKGTRSQRRCHRPADRRSGIRRSK